MNPPADRPTSTQAAFPVRGVIEGFYGVYYSHPERLSLLRFLGRHGYNLYVYGPKNDRHHRRHWRRPYPESAMARFAETVALAQEQGIEFCFTLAPGIDITYGSEEEFASLTNKLQGFLDLGVRSFGLLLDDIRRRFSDPADAERFGSFAQAQAHLCNRTLEWLRERDGNCRLIMCPTEYHGLPPYPESLEELGANLHPDIDVFHTGPEVCSATIDAPPMQELARVLRRQPVIWDNYPVNDLAMQGELHIGPIRGRSAHLQDAVKGVAVNPMNQAEASKVVLATYGEFLHDPDRYRPEEAWARAIAEVAGENAPAFTLVANTSLHSCLGGPEAPRLEELVEAALQAFELDDHGAPEIDELYEYLRELDEACYELRYEPANLRLRDELLPWLEQLEQWTWLGRWSIEALRSLAAQPQGSGPEGRNSAPDELRREEDEGRLRRIREYVKATSDHPKRIAGNLLEPLARLALERARETGVIGQ